MVMSRWVISKNGEDKLAEDSRMHCIIAANEWRRYDYLALVGGCFVKGQKIPVAILMRNFLASRRVPENRIIIENSSVDTEENVAMLMEILDQKFNRNDLQITALSHPAHLRRVIRAFKRRRIKIKTFPVYYPLGFKMWFYEWLAYWCPFLVIFNRNLRHRL